MAPVPAQTNAIPIHDSDSELGEELNNIDAACIDAACEAAIPFLTRDPFLTRSPIVKDLLKDQGGHASSSDEECHSDKNNAAEQNLVDRTRSPYTVQHRREQTEQACDNVINDSSLLSGLQEAFEHNSEEIKPVEIE